VEINLHCGEDGKARGYNSADISTIGRTPDPRSQIKDPASSSKKQNPP
jgi:hypothetical protein